MKKLVCLAAFAVAVVSTQASLTWEFGWEDGTSTAIEQYGTNLTMENSDEQASEGTRSLKMIEDPASGTPQGFVWWVTGLTDGDIVTAAFDVHSAVLGTNPRGRIWGHYTQGTTDPNNYEGSASGNLTYSDGGGWSNLSHSWTFDSDGNARNGLMVEARIYSAAAGDFIYIDNTTITVSSNTAQIMAADGATMIPEPSTFALLGLGALALVVRRSRH